MKKTWLKICAFGVLLLTPASAFAATNPEVDNFTRDAMTAFIGLVSVAVDAS